MEENTKKLITNIVCTLLYAIFTLILVLHHETWADEAQVWLLAKHLSVFDFSLFKHLVNEGHPSFFYILMMPFAKMNISIMFMQIFCWLCMVASVFLFLQYSPFNKFAKFAIVTSSGFLYFFPVIARSYSIIPLLVFVLAFLYPKSAKHPYWYAALLFMLANTHVIMFAFCGLLALDFLYENLIKVRKELDKNSIKKYAAAFGIMCIGLIAVVLQLHGTTSSNVVIRIDYTDNFVINTIKVLSQFFINAVDNQWPENQQIMFPLLNLPLILLSVFLYIGLLAAILIKNKKFFTIVFLSILFQIIIYIYYYSHWIFVTRIFCAHIILIFCLWLLLQQENISEKFNKIINFVVALFFLFTCLNGLKYSVMDIKYDYSGAKETAQWIEKHIDKDKSVIITDNDPYSIGIVYYLNGANEIYSAQHEYNIKYVVWDKKIFYILDKDGWDKYAKYVVDNEYFKNKKIYALVPFFDTDILKVSELKNYKLIYQSHPAIVKLEGFRIYEYLGDIK